MLNHFVSGFLKKWATHSRLALAGIAPTVTKIPSKKEDDSEAPELVQVVYVTRHGLRTPLSDSKNTVSGFPWECLSEEETIRIFTEDVELHRADEGPERGSDRASISRSRLPPGLFEPVFSGDKDLHFGKNCHAGQLTVAGHNQMRAMGEKVGQRYKTELGLLSKEWDPSAIAIRSTNSARTIETALELVNGMYPLRPRTQPLRVELHAVNAETMYPHSSCTFIGDIYKSFRKSDERQRIKDELASLFVKSEFKSEEEYDFYTRRSLPALCNTVATLHGHGFPLPQGIRDSHVDAICDISGKEYEAVYHLDKRMTKLAIGRFLGEILDVLKDKVESDTFMMDDEKLLGISTMAERAPAKFVLMSGHDNTIAPLILNLELMSGVHPPMGSHLAFELYKQPPPKRNAKGAVASEPEYFVQTVYNFKPVPLPACGNKLQCPFDDFVKIVTPRTPSNYHAECDTEKML